MKCIPLFTLIGGVALGLSLPAFAGDHGRGGGGGGFGGGNFVPGASVARGASVAAPQVSHFSAPVRTFSRSNFSGTGFQRSQGFQNQVRTVNVNPSFSRPVVTQAYTAPVARASSSFQPVQRNVAVNRNFTSTNANATNQRAALAANRTAFNRGNNYGGRWVRGGAHPDWDRARAYVWHNHHYRWYDGGWLIVDGGFWPDDYGYQSDYVGEYNPAPAPEISITDVQSRLAQQGYYNGPLDGVVGPGTQSAIAAYQSDNDLGVTGTVDEPLLQSLGLE